MSSGPRGSSEFACWVDGESLVNICILYTSRHKRISLSIEMKAERCTHLTSWTWRNIHNQMIGG